MHRATPANSSFRGYVAGGARVTVPNVDDSKLMQESTGNFMANESRSAIEAPQNYGFTSVVRDADKNGQGQITGSAETFVSFMGGNRSFPVLGNMDDRRYRLKDLKKGDVGMFDYLQHQLHMNNDGVFLTGRNDKKLKLQLADPPQQQQSSQQRGQQQRYTQSGKQYLQMTKDKTDLAHDQKIDYETPLHSFMQSASATTFDASSYLVQIFGSKFTGGYGYFMKQVTAAPPTSPFHLSTKNYIDSIISGLGFTMPSLPSLGLPPLPPGVTLPPGFTIPMEAELVSSQTSLTWVDELSRRLNAIEARLAAIEEKIG
jgi:hypothetical protein